MSSYAEFGGKYTVPDPSPLDIDDLWNTPWQGIQDEFELLRGDGWLDGVVSGARPVTTNGTSSLTVPAGRFYVQGKRSSANETLVITGYPAGSYNLYYDSSDDTTTLKATTASLNSAQFQLATFTWDGAGTASTAIVLTDNGTGSKQGIERNAREVTFAGLIATTSRRILPIYENSWVEAVESVCVNNGTASGGTLVFDVLLGADGSEGTTIFTTTTRRPNHTASQSSYTISVAGEPDGDRFPDAGEHLTIKPVEVFAVGTASDATVTVWLRPR